MWYSPLGGLADLTNRRIVSLSGRAGSGNSTLYDLVIYDLDTDAEISNVPQFGFSPVATIVPFYVVSGNAQFLRHAAADHFAVGLRHE